MQGNRENILKWVTALESGDYVQGVGALNRNGRFCCLGVAAEVAIADGVPLWRDTGGHGAVSYHASDNCIGSSECVCGVSAHCRISSLPPLAAEWLGLGVMDDVLVATGANGPILAADANDGLGWSFVEIAAALRKTYLEEGDVRE